MTSRGDLPKRGFVFWPVGNGDSITVLIDEDRLFQVDLHHMEQAEDDSDPHVAVIDELVEILDGRPLSGFALTHPDLDHCRGFSELLDRVTIGELWLTPRIFRENTDGELNDDAEVFCNEAMRRVKKTIELGGLPGQGDRVRIIGWDELLNEDDFFGFPKDLLTIPGSTVTGLDGEDHEGFFRAFIHAPFSDDSAAERNATSLGMQITLADGACSRRAILLGDLPAPTIKRIFCEVTDDPANLAWDAYLGPHHCSKGALYIEDADTGEERPDDELVDALERNSELGAYVLASCGRFDQSDDQPGDDPPHLRARELYESIVDAGHFVATSEHGDSEASEPIVIAVDRDECGYRQAGSQSAGAALLGAVSQARGSRQPPPSPQGFGCQHGG